MKSIVIIGGGQSGLAAAFYLARAGLRPIVLEARDSIGGGAITTELHAGFRCPTLTHHTPLWTSVGDDMDLERHGLEWLVPDVERIAIDPDGPPAVLYADAQQTADAMRPRHAKDADAYLAYRASIERIATVVGSALARPVPDIDNPGLKDAWTLLGIGRRFRGLGARDGYRLLRWAPMAMADLAREWFESELLCAAVAGPALSGSMLGPRSAGSGLVLLLQEAHRLLAGGVASPRGGPGMVTLAMAAAAHAAGAEIRLNSPVERILVRNDEVVGVLARGGEIPAAVVVSAVDPKTTFLHLVDPADLAPEFRLKIRHYRAMGTLAKVNLALSRLPRFVGVDPTRPELLSGRIHLGTTLDYVERAFDHAKYGEMSAEPWLDVTIPSVLDPTLAPPGAHVMSIYAHYAPYRLKVGDWESLGERLMRTVLATLERFAPGLGELIVAGQVITPDALESQYGFHGGHIFHGELALDQLATMRPLLGFGRHNSPIRGLFLCGAGTHPGGFMTGASGKLAAREIVKALR